MVVVGTGVVVRGAGVVVVVEASVVVDTGGAVGFIVVSSGLTVVVVVVVVVVVDALGLGVVVVVVLRVVAGVGAGLRVVVELLLAPVTGGTVVVMTDARRIGTIRVFARVMLTGVAWLKFEPTDTPLFGTDGLPLDDRETSSLCEEVDWYLGGADLVTAGGVFLRRFVTLVVFRAFDGRFWKRGQGWSKCWSVAGDF